MFRIHGYILTAILFVIPILAQSQETAHLTRQRHFANNIPPGNYSGITYLGQDRYAVVNDKASHRGFSIMNIRIDPVDGQITDVHLLDNRLSNHIGKDAEDIAYNRESGILWIVEEDGNNVMPLDTLGHIIGTGNGFTLPSQYQSLPPNLGLEALTYSAADHLIWTCNESSPITLTAFDESGNVRQSIPYNIDIPKKKYANPKRHSHGVPALCALPNGNLLVLEREVYIPKWRIGAWVKCKLYRILPKAPANKKLLCQWTTRLNLFSRSWANYEGMCMGPKLSDGRNLLVLVSDSQNQYKKVLRDWFRTIVLTD